MEGKRLVDVSQVKQDKDGVVVQVVDEGIALEKVEEIVNNCKTGQCDCMSEATKQKVEFIHVKLIGGKPAIEIKGDVSKQEIEEAISKSKKIVG